MKRSKFSEEQLVYALRPVGAGTLPGTLVGNALATATSGSS
jgi:hypothetical protein